VYVHVYVYVYVDGWALTASLGERGRASWPVTWPGWTYRVFGLEVLGGDGRARADGAGWV